MTKPEGLPEYHAPSPYNYTEGTSALPETPKCEPAAKLDYRQVYRLEACRYNAVTLGILFDVYLWLHNFFPPKVRAKKIPISHDKNMALFPVTKTLYYLENVFNS